MNIEIQKDKGEPFHTEHHQIKHDHYRLKSHLDLISSDKCLFYEVIAVILPTTVILVPSPK